MNNEELSKAVDNVINKIPDKKYFRITIITTSGVTISRAWVEEKYLTELKNNMRKDHVVNGDDFSAHCAEINFILFTQQCDED